MAERPETVLEMARRHVTEAKGRIARQSELVRKMVANKHPNAAAAQQLLVTMETTLYVMQKHLQFKEQQYGQNKGSDA